MQNVPTPRIALLEPVYREYQSGFFRALQVQHGGDLIIYAGRDDPRSGHVGSGGLNPFQELNNMSLLGGTFIWQKGFCDDLIEMPLVIAAGSLRTLSSHWLMLKRGLAGRPTIIWAHAIGRIEKASAARLAMFRLADGFIAFNNADAEAVRRLRGDRKVWVAPSSCVWKRDCVQVPFDSDSRPIRTAVIFAGRLDQETKPLLLVDAFHRGVRSGGIPTDSKLVMIGAGPLRSKAGEFTKSLGLEGRVVFAGHIADQSLLSAFYARSIVAVVPGRCGMSVIRALSTGTPVIISDDATYGPEREACERGRNAVSFEKDSAASLARALVEVVNGRQEWGLRGSEICELVSQTFTIDSMLAGFTEAIESTIKSNRFS